MHLPKHIHIYIHIHIHIYIYIHILLFAKIELFLEQMDGYSSDLSRYIVVIDIRHVFLGDLDPIFKVMVLY